MTRFTRRETPTNLGGILFESLDAFRGLPVRIWLHRCRVSRAMTFQHRRRCGLQLLGRSLEVRARAAAVLQRVASQLHAANCEHLAYDEAWFVAHRDHCRKDASDALAQSAHALGDRSFSWHARFICRLLTMPCEYAKSTILSGSADGYAGAPVASF